MKKFLAVALAMLMVLCLVACGAGEEAAAETTPAPTEVVVAADDAAAPAGDTADAGDASGEASAEGGMGNQSTDFEIEANGVSGTAHYEDVDSGDQATKSFVITFDGADIEGQIEMGVWTATSGDAADQAVVDAVHTAFESSNTSGEASGEVAA